jgi:hypothetical protein
MQTENMLQKVNNYQFNWKEHVNIMQYTKLPKLPYLYRTTATGPDRWREAERNRKKKRFKITNIGKDLLHLI